MSSDIPLPILPRHVNPSPRGGGAFLVGPVAAIVLLGVLGIGQTSERPADSTGPNLRSTYYSIGFLEPDKVASAWLITRHVNPGATVLVLAKGAGAPAGAVPFDMPGAKWVRSARRCAFEAIIEEESVDDSVLKRIGKLVRAGELSGWLLKAESPESRFDRIMKSLTAGGTVEGAYSFLDQVYANGGDVPHESSINDLKPGASGD